MTTLFFVVEYEVVPLVLIEACLDEISRELALNISTTYNAVYYHGTYIAIMSLYPFSWP